MLKTASASAEAGDWVHVYDKNGGYFGAGFYHPRARVPLRVLHHGYEPRDSSVCRELLQRAIALRHESLRLPESTNAYRLVNSDGDGLSGLIIDRYADWLFLQSHSLGLLRWLEPQLPWLLEACGARQVFVQVDEQIARMEEIDLSDLPGQQPESLLRIQENGVRYWVDLARGHKTGFFCDQRENRKLLAGYCAGKNVLDLCCYTGGFAVTAKTLGKAEEVTGVDLDEEAVAMARRNGNLNQQTKIHWVHADAFSYCRQMRKNEALWDVVICDPPKLVGSREEQNEGLRKYHDLNCLAVGLVRPGGIFVTCSCSGLVSQEQFTELVIHAAHSQHQRLQFLPATGAGPDHPVYSNCRESQYLKVLWARVLPTGTRRDRPLPEPG